VLFWVRITFAIQGLLCFHMSLRIEFSVSVKNYIGILMVTVLTLQITFSSTAIFTVLILVMQDHEESFHVLLPAFISSVLYNFHY
jgi:hypothetical protein